MKIRILSTFACAAMLSSCVQSQLATDSKLDRLAESQAEIKSENAMTNDAILNELKEIRAAQISNAELLKQISELKTQNARLLKELSQFRADAAKAQIAHDKTPEGASAGSKEVVYSAKPSATKAPDGKLIVGSEEWALLEDFDLALLARVDTGATTSGIDAQNIQQFERDGKKWYRFDVPDLKGELHHLEGRFVRNAEIYQSSNSDSTQIRPVVNLKIRLGDVTKNAEFTLANRGHMVYALLLGREFMKDDVLVDIGKEKIQGKPAAAAYIDKRAEQLPRKKKEK